MKKKIEKILKIWHTHFENEEHQYSEFEDSDIEYFVGCLLYNHFALSYSLDTMKTIDLSYDFISECGDEYDEVLEIIKDITFDNELQKLEFLQSYIAESQAKYSDDELYLLNRLQYHVDGIRQRYDTSEEAKKINFEAPAVRSANPLLR